MANNTIISFITRAFLPSLSLSFFFFQFQFSIYVYIHRSKRGGSFSKGEILTSIELDEIFRLFNFSIARGHRDRSLAPGRETLNVTRRDWRFSRFGNFSLSSRFLKQPSCPLSSVPLSRIADGSRQSQSARVPERMVHRFEMLPESRYFAYFAPTIHLRAHDPRRNFWKRGSGNYWKRNIYSQEFLTNLSYLSGLLNKHRYNIRNTTISFWYIQQGTAVGREGRRAEKRGGIVATRWPPEKNPPYLHLSACTWINPSIGSFIHPSIIETGTIAPV